MGADYLPPPLRERSLPAVMTRTRVKVSVVPVVTFIVMFVPACIAYPFFYLDAAAMIIKMFYYYPTFRSVAIMARVASIVFMLNVTVP